MTVINFAEAAFRVRLKRTYTREELLNRRYDVAVRPAFLVALVRGLRAKGANDQEVRMALTEGFNDGLNRFSSDELEAIAVAGSTAVINR